MQLSVGRVFQTEETASTKTMRQEFPGVFKCVSAVRTEWNGNGSIIGDRPER